MNDLIFDDQFTQATMLAAEGARVGIVTCRECGAAILLDPRDTIDPLLQHRAWHEALEETK